jgi:hypothetical protein
MGRMMEGIAFVRVFCEPEAHALLTRVVSVMEISESISRAVDELKDDK